MLAVPVTRCRNAFADIIQTTKDSPAKYPTGLCFTLKLLTQGLMLTKENFKSNPGKTERNWKN